METEFKKNIVLAIESAIAGGSVCLLQDGREIAHRVGDGGVSRAEELLGIVSEMLDSTGIQKNSIGLVAVSNGPGSYTGIRIGIATAIGLKHALNIPVVGVDTLEAMAKWASGLGPTLAAISFGKNDAAWQAFRSEGEHSVPSGIAVVTGVDEFVSNALGSEYEQVVVSPDLYEKLRVDANFQQITHRDNISTVIPALAIGHAASISDNPPKPLYLRNADLPPYAV